MCVGVCEAYARLVKLGDLYSNGTKDDSIHDGGQNEDTTCNASLHMVEGMCVACGAACPDEGCVSRGSHHADQTAKHRHSPTVP